MKVDLVFPLERVSGMLGKNSDYYFATRNGQTYLRRRPRKTAKAVRARKSLAAQTQRNRFTEVAHMTSEIMQSIAMKAHYLTLYQQYQKSHSKNQYKTLRGFIFGQLSKEYRQGISSTR